MHPLRPVVPLYKYAEQRHADGYERYADAHFHRMREAGEHHEECADNEVGDGQKEVDSYRARKLRSRVPHPKQTGHGAQRE